MPATLTRFRHRMPCLAGARRCAWAAVLAGCTVAQADTGCDALAHLIAGLGVPCQTATRTDDGRWLAVAGGQPPVLRLYALPDKGQATPVWAATHALALLNGQAASGAQPVFEAPGRTSLVTALDGLPELWEVHLSPSAEPIHDGLVHDYRMGEAIAKPGFLGVRRTPLAQPVRVLGLDTQGTHAFTVPTAAPTQVEVVNLDVRRRIATLAVPPGVQPERVQRRVCGGTSVVVLGISGAGQPWAVTARAPWAHTRACETDDNIKQ